MKKYSRNHIGEIWKTKEGYNCKIIDGGSKRNYCTIKIENWTAEKQYINAKKGSIKYPFHKSVHGIGYFGEGKYKAYIKRKGTKAYKTWKTMLQRCYDKKYQKRKHTYIGVTVCDDWLNFQIFAEWFLSNYKDGYHLDKDLLSEPEHKIYSAKTCIFIPRALNSFLANKKLHNTSGYTGVSWNKIYKKWEAYIFVSGKLKHLGYFEDIKDAIKTYKKERKERTVQLQLQMKNILPNFVIEKIL